MKLRLLIIFLVFLLLPVICAAAPKKKNSPGNDRGLTAVSKTTGDGRRVALVIGNGAYRHTNSMPKLANPVNDADDIAAALRGFGFDVVLKKNLTREEMDDTIADFGRRIVNSDAALFFFAGHGLQVKGQNYLVPVDANISSEAQVPHRSVNINQLLEEMDNSKSRVNIVILDACRNNPISGKFRSGAIRGLAPPAAMPKGTVIVYATDPGNVAADGNGRNGLFTLGLLSAFKGSDLTLDVVLYRASKLVEQGSNYTQTPYINGPPTVQREFSFVPGKALVAEEPQQVAMAPRPQESTARAESEPKSTSLDDIIASTELAERARKERTEKIMLDIAKYRKITTSRPEIKQQAWAALVSSYPEGRSVPVGEVGKLMKALGMRGGEDPATGIELVSVPEGCFQMGSTGNADEQPVHQVCVSGFNIGKYEVTQGQWKKVMGSNPSHFSSCGDNCPVEQVSWNDIQQFISRLNSQSGTNYRLPTEAEWEYACRAGGTEEYCGSNDINGVAWYKDNSWSQTHPVGQKQANAWGIYDMSGNVWEWVNDWYDKSYYSGSPQSNPQGPSSGSYRVNRGGGWVDDSAGVRASGRDTDSPENRYDDLGFRLVAPAQ